MSESNNKKLIGTIIGVIFFVILIAGATFAWLTYTANVNNGVYNVGTTHFVVTYTGDDDVTDLPILSPDATFGDYPSSSIISGSAYKDSANVDGILTLKLHVEDTPDNAILLGAECIRYLVMYENSTLLDSYNNSSMVLKSFDNNYSQKGILTASDMDSNRDISLYSAVLKADLNSLALGRPIYRIYLWYDNELVTNEVDGKIFNGYIHASAIQSDPNR